MNDDEDYLMRPVIEGMCLYESLIDGRLDLADIARMHEALDIHAENRARVEEALEDSRRG
jgi:hypothetical protein